MFGCPDKVPESNMRGYRRILCALARRVDFVVRSTMRHLDRLKAVTVTCVWCNCEFSPRNSGGSPQRFCCPAHRRAFHIAAHQFVLAELSAGRVSVGAIKKLARADRMPEERLPKGGPI